MKMKLERYFTITSGKYFDVEMDSRELMFLNYGCLKFSLK